MASPCCQTAHPFDTFQVTERWWPKHERFLIIGESPGGRGSPYFYDLAHAVRIRRNLLLGLESCGLIPSQSLEAFKESGFLFDHAIRCPLPVTEVKYEWRRARGYSSFRTATANHLHPALSSFQIVWAMGYLARNAVACADISFPRERRGLDAPYVVEGVRRYFVSRYLLHISDGKIITICEAFKAFCKI